MKARSRFAIITTTVAALTLSAFVASAEMKSAGGGALEFSLPGGTAGLKIEGKSEKVSASESGGKVTVVADLDCGTGCLKTGIDKRDEHLRKTLEVDKKSKDGKSFGSAVMTVDKSAVKLPADGEKAEGDATGSLFFHGVTKPTKFHYAIKRTGSDYHVHANFTVKIEDFGIEQPSFAGVHTGSVVDVKVKFKLREG